jgi:hypothetical protein
MRLSQGIRDDFTSVDRGALVATVVEVGQLFVVKAEATQKGRVDVMHMGAFLDCA